MPSKKKISVFAVPYSPNLGDGVISMAIRNIILDIGEADVVVKDIAGRSALSDTPPALGLREIFVRFAHLIPSGLRRLLVSRLVVNRVIRNNHGQWAEAIADSDLVLIGGGNLLSDVDLNFPKKICAVAALCDQNSKPFHLICMGCSQNWSSEGRRIMDSIWHNPYLKGVSLRDDISLSNFRKAFPEARSIIPEVVADPAIYLRRDEIRTATNSGKLNLGLCVSDVRNLAYSGDGEIDFGPEELADFFRNLVSWARSDGWTVQLFTNGAWEDEKFLQEICRHPEFANIRLPRPSSPSDLVGLISNFKAMSGFRLHAHIICYALGISSLPLDWDSKLNGFFELTGNIENLTSVTALNRERFREFLEKSMADTWTDWKRKESLRNRLTEYFTRITGLTNGSPGPSAADSNL